MPSVTSKSAFQPGTFIITLFAVVNEKIVPLPDTSTHERSRLPRSIRHDLGKKFSVPHLPHFYTTSLRFFAAVQKGRVASVISGIGLPAASIFISLIYASAPNTRVAQLRLFLA